MDSRRKNDHVVAEKLLYKRHRNGSGLVNNQELSLRKFCMILRPNILNGLPVVAENINAHNSVVELWVCALHDLVVCVLFVVQSIKALQNELE